MDGIPSRTLLLGAFAAGQGESATARCEPLLSLAVPCFMPQTCPKGSAQSLAGVEPSPDDGRKGAAARLPPHGTFSAGHRRLRWRIWVDAFERPREHDRDARKVALRQRRH